MAEEKKSKEEITLEKKQKELTRVSNEITKLDELESSIDSEDFIKNKISEIDKIESSLPDKKPKNPENITMKQHLQNIKKEIEKNPTEFIKKQKVKISNARNEFEKLKSDLEVELGS